jgi:hypothetical protein
MSQSSPNLLKNFWQTQGKNPKAFYRYVNSKLKTKRGVANLKRENGSLAETDIGKANMLNNFFSSVFTHEDKHHLPLTQELEVTNPLTDVEITEQEVDKLLQQLNSDKLPGPEGIHPRILKECLSLLSAGIQKLYRKSLDAGTVPEDWRTGHVTPIFKKGAGTQVGNYRPVSLTSVVCKVMEKIIRKAILDHLTNKGILSEYQHGFGNGRSFSTQLLHVVDRVSEILDRGVAVDAVYLYFAKAFNKVPHERLLLKLEMYGVKGKILRWVRSFFTDRRQRVVLSGLDHTG